MPAPVSCGEVYGKAVAICVGFPMGLKTRKERNDMSKPLLSIGIIFKNEIRCLERCLKSLQPLRDMIPCEVVMADTGSDDGSREVAERYADILFDFPWINDFAAARNAVMDHSSGDWYLSIDADEWLGGDLSELAKFVQPGNKFKGNVASLSILNYTTPDLDDNYAEFLIYRLFRMSTGVRYEGAIHERWPYEKTGTRAAFQLSRTILHHDGYVGLYGEAGKAKRERNLALLREALEKDPDNIRTLVEWLDSGKEEPNYLDELRRAMELVRHRCPGWEEFGPSVFRYAAVEAKERGLPELKEWIQEARERFPKSIFTQIDVEYIDFVQSWDEKDYAKCIAIGKPCLKRIIDLREGRIDKGALAFGTVLMHGPHWEEETKTFLSEAYLREKQPEKCRKQLEQLNCNCLNQTQTGRVVHTLFNLHTQSDEDTAALIKAVWAGIQEPVPNQERAEERRSTFLQEASTAFRSLEAKEGRPAYTLLLPLAGECEIGNAAAILEQTDAAELERLLAQVEQWDELPIKALSHALGCGARFPLPEKPLNVEEMDGLISRLTGDRDSFFPLVGRMLQNADFETNGQRLVWARGIVLAAVQAYKWKDSENVDEGLALARDFAWVEGQFLSRCYTPEALCEEGLFMLPPIHRFGWWCLRAFETLNLGDAVGYVRCLRRGLDTCNSMKSMVEFLTEHTPELQARPEPSAELLALAEQIRTVLANFAPDDSAVTALKQSAAYQKVAYLIEGLEPPVIGGLLQ